MDILLVAFEVKGQELADEVDRMDHDHKLYGVFIPCFGMLNVQGVAVHWNEKHQRRKMDRKLPIQVRQEHKWIMSFKRSLDHFQIINKIKFQPKDMKYYNVTVNSRL